MFDDATDSDDANRVLIECL